MGRLNQTKVEDHTDQPVSFQSDYIEKARLNVNELLKRRQAENKIDRKTNILIFSGATTIAVLVIVTLSL